MEDGPDTCGASILWTGETDFPTVDPDRARRVLVDAGKNLDQCRLAGAVLPHQRMNLACSDIERHIGERCDGAELLAH
ncbi:hypothetical protein OMK68_08010 [Rhodococcus pyridinivorans]|nr:hypothetical protein [Rhodococcus pyridinivorans]MCW3469585.1 hypothetical protein [Rhodococcus pyridinivorans]